MICFALCKGLDTCVFTQDESRGVVSPGSISGLDSCVFTQPKE